jgi:hypothetical protein
VFVSGVLAYNHNLTSASYDVWLYVTVKPIKSHSAANKLTEDALAKAVEAKESLEEAIVTVSFASVPTDTPKTKASLTVARSLENIVYSVLRSSSRM